MIMANKTIQEYDVYRNGKKIDTIFYNFPCNESSDDVKKSLIDHDGYPCDIRVVKRK
jgi:hypothetical protein